MTLSWGENFHCQEKTSKGGEVSVLHRREVVGETRSRTILFLINLRTHVNVTSVRTPMTGLIYAALDYFFFV